MERTASISDSTIDSPTIRSIVQHVCQEHEALFADVVELCESRYDCATVVVCPVCEQHFVLDEEELVELRIWSEQTEGRLGCGVRWN